MTVKDQSTPVQALEVLSEQMAKVHAQIATHVIGQDAVIEQSLITILSGGHLLLIGLPGLGKTRLVETMGTVLGLDEKRVQFTPDLMPSDIIGSEILEEDQNAKRHFRFLPGPIFTQLLMADEINRASPRTQSALLQAMQEKRVSIAGHYHDLPRPFHVLATQNPLEQEGTYPLPEAQLDRFFMEVQISYPTFAAEKDILLKTTGAEQTQPTRLFDAERLLQAQDIVRNIPIGDQVVEAILHLIRNARPDSSQSDAIKNHVSWGPGPRAGQALMLGVKARALLQGRLSPSIDDVIALSAPVLRHRMALNFAARAEGVSLNSLLDHLIEGITP